MSTKIDNIKNKALNNKPFSGDYTSLIETYKKRIKEFQNQLNEDAKIIEALEDKFNSLKDSILSSEELSKSEKSTAIQKGFVTYLIEKAKLNRVGKAIIFFDKSQGKFVELSRVKKEDTQSGETREERILEYLEDKTVKKLINLEAKRIIKNILPQKIIAVIIEWLDPYTKVFAPLQKKMYGDFYNVYTPNGFLEVKVKNIIELDNFANNIMPNKYPFINALFNNLAPKEEERKYLLNWLSYILNTSNKTRNAIALIGIQGSGKGVLQEQIIEYAINPDNSYTVTNDDLKAQFNGYVENRLFLFFNEIKTSFSETSTQADKIKPMITDSRISMNDKYLKQKSMDNYANCMFFSNHDLPFQIEEKDRRYSVIKTEHKTLSVVAKEKFGVTIKKFIEVLKKERDSFLVEMKMLKLTEETEKLALGLLDNETKKKIKEQTNTMRDIIKEKILDRDERWFEQIISDSIEGIENEKTKDKMIEKVIHSEITGEDTVISIPLIFQYTNVEYKSYLIDEVKQGIFSNETLRWFTKIYEIESANSNHKFGKFWNLIINSADTYHISDNGKQKSIKLRLLNMSKIDVAEIMIHGDTYTLKEGTTKVLEKGAIPF